MVTIPKDGLGKDGCQKTLHKKDDQGHDIYETRAVPAFLISNSEEDPCHRVSSPLEDEDSYFLQRFGESCRRVLSPRLFGPHRWSDPGLRQR